MRFLSTSILFFARASFQILPPPCFRRSFWKRDIQKWTLSLKGGWEGCLRISTMKTPNFIIPNVEHFPSSTMPITQIPSDSTQETSLKFWTERNGNRDWTRKERQIMKLLVTNTQNRVANAFRSLNHCCPISRNYLYEWQLKKKWVCLFWLSQHSVNVLNARYSEKFHSVIDISWISRLFELFRCETAREFSEPYVDEADFTIFSS